jgi:hypothetical protein
VCIPYHTSNPISFLSEETQRKLRGDDEDPFEDQAVIINTQQELRRSADIMALEHRVFITPRNPRSDGAVEKQMSTLKDEIASYVKNTTMDTWDEFLSVAAFHYNTTVNEATTFTPFFMIHGREASTSEDAHLGQLVERYSSVNAYIEQMRKALLAV